MNLLIILNKAEFLKQSLELEFPGLTIHAKEKEEQALDIIMGRGDTVNEMDLIEVLKTGKIAGAGLVYFTGSRCLKKALYGKWKM